MRGPSGSPYVSATMKALARSLGVTFVSFVGACALLTTGACRHHSATAPNVANKQATPVAVRPSGAIPRITGPIKIDGEWDEHDWSNTALRGQFLGSDGRLSRPSSEARFLHDDKDLIVALYAGDENIQSTDAFGFTVGTLALHVTATAKVTPAVPGVRAAVGYDEGTLDHPQDDDEEWVVELAIPLSATGLAPGVHVPVHAARCDTPKDNIQRCGSWSGSLTVE